MKRFLLLSFFAVSLLFATAIPAMSQNEVPAVLAPDDSLPILRSVMLDPSNHPVTFPPNSFFDVFTELSFDFSGSSRAPAMGVPHVFVWDASVSLRAGDELSGTGTIFRINDLEMVVNSNPSSPVGDIQVYDTEMLSLSISGGSLPGGVMIRESPTLASTGKHTIKPVSGGRFVVDSFFDVFFELSVDGGGTWMPADGSVRMEAKIKPTILINRPDPPPIVAGRYIGDLDRDGLPDLVVTLPEESQTVAVDTTKVYNLQSGFIYYVSARGLLASPGHTTIKVKHTFDDGGTQYFDTEMLQMDISGGALPSGMMLRESPTRASTGRTSIRAMGNGQSQVSNFFDIFVDLSVDGGQTWTPQPPVSLDLREPLIPVVPTVLAPNNSFPVPGSVMLDPSNTPVTFDSFFDIFTELSVDFTGTTPVKPPLPGASQNQSMSGVARFHLSLDGGATVQVHTCPVGATLSMASSSNSGDTRMFDTEMLSLNLSGGSLPSGVMLRESPTKQSLGQHYIRESPSRPTRISSFFDVFFELSVDGGQTWMTTDVSIRPIRIEMKRLHAPATVSVESVMPPGTSLASIGDPDFDLLRITHNTVPPPPVPPVGSSSISTIVVKGDLTIDRGTLSVQDASLTYRATGNYSDGTTSSFDTEMLQLDISGGTLPTGTMVRESPSKASLGRTSIRTLPSGTEFEISSFFDVFTELSLDGGQTWTPQEPTTLEFSDASYCTTCDECLTGPTYPDDLFPFASKRRISDIRIVHPPGTPPGFFTNGTLFRNHNLRWHDGAPRAPLPSLGAFEIYTSNVELDMQIAPPGQPFQDALTDGLLIIRYLHSSDDGSTRMFETEILGLNLSGSVPFMIRESPTRQSLGQTTVKPNGSGFQIDSFFDIFYEISSDGGASWSESPIPTRVVQEMYSEDLPVASSNFPPPGVYKVNQTAGEQCDNGFGNNARLFRPAFFDVFADFALPPPGGSSTNTFTARSRVSVSLDGGSSFFDVFFDVEGSIQCDATNSVQSPPTQYFDTEMLSLNLQPLGGDLTVHGNIMLRESPTKQSLGKTTLRESPTLPKIGSFFDVFLELSLDGGQTWSEALSSMRIELDTVKPGTITGMKWHDADGDGVKGGAETGLSNWKIFLTDTLGTIIDTVRTDIAGDYQFSNLPVGTYRIYEEGQAGWIQTGGVPAYGFILVPGDTSSGNDFGNFLAPNLTGVKFNDHNSDGIRDLDDEGVPGWEIGLFPKNIPTPGTTVSSGTGVYSLRLNGLPPGEPVIGTLSAYLASKKGYDYYQAQSNLISTGVVSRPILKSYFENGQIPTEVLALSLQSTAPIDVGGHSIEVAMSKKHTKTGHVTLLKHRQTISASSELHSSFFDIFVDITIDDSGVKTTCTVPMVLEADLLGDGEPEPLAEGMVYRSGPVELIDDEGTPVGTLDTLVITVGPPASQLNPVYTKTDGSGQYSFSPMLPGEWNVIEQSQPCWEQTTSPMATVVVTSGATLPQIDFGNHQNLGEICVTKYWDVNHNQTWESSSEPPMAGVNFVLTGLINTFTKATGSDGKACFTDLPPDSYMLTEVLPAGYAYSVPKDGQMGPFDISGCEQITDLVWLNTGAGTVDSFRTARYEDWALAVDQKGKPKPVKAKDDKVILKFNIVAPREGFTGFELDFGMLTTGQVTEGKDKLVLVGDPFTGVKKIAFSALSIDSLDTFQIDAIGAKGKKAKVKVKWTGRLVKPVTVKQTLTDYKRNDPQLPMPNLHNIGQELFGFGQPSYFTAGLLIGTPQGEKKARSVLHLKYSDVLKSLVKYSDGVPILHEDSIRCLDIFPGGDLMKSQVKGLSPVKNSNKLFGALLAAKLNVAASVQGKFPIGLGELTYLDKSEPGNPFNGQTINEIIVKADSIISCLNINTKLTVPTVAELYDVLMDIDTAFYGNVDTISFAVKTSFKGVRDLKSVSYLYATPGLTPAANLPGTRQAVTPLAYRLEQNYPNPFNPMTTIEFSLLEPSTVTLKVYNTLGQEVVSLLDNVEMDEGAQDVEFDAGSLSSGVYYYRITVQGLGDTEEGIAGNSYTSVKKMMLMK